MSHTPIKIRKGAGRYLYRLNYRMDVWDMMRNPETRKWEIFNRSDPDMYCPTFDSKSEAVRYIESQTDKKFK